MTSKRKVFVPTKSGDVIRTSVRISKRMAADVNAAVTESGRNKRERSAWAIDVLQRFVDHDDAAMLVSEEFFESPMGGSTNLSLSLPVTLQTQITTLLNQVEREHNAKKDRSAVIRAAFMTQVSSIRVNA